MKYQLKKYPATLKEVREVLEERGFNTVSLREGVFTARKEFFYTNGRTSQDVANVVLGAFEGVTIIDHGEVWKPFRGGASTRDSSHWWVKFVFNN